VLADRPKVVFATGIGVATGEYAERRDDGT
jgi:hypothetical protein